MKRDFNPVFFNKKVGHILLQNRTRVGFSRTEVSQKIKELTPFDLNEIENGKRSIPCSTLYKLLTKVYSPTETEILFFCCPLASLREDISPEKQH